VQSDLLDRRRGWTRQLRPGSAGGLQTSRVSLPAGPGYCDQPRMVKQLPGSRKVLRGPGKWSAARQVMPGWHGRRAGLLPQHRLPRPLQLPARFQAGLSGQHAPGPLAGGSASACRPARLQRQHLPGLFDATHMGADCRYPLSLAWLWRRSAE
jgi:hypothetical protein